MKPTCLSSTLLGLSECAVRCDGRHAHEKSIGRGPRGEHLTRRLQTYPPPLCRAIALALVKTAVAMLTQGWGPGGWNRPQSSAPRRNHWSFQSAKPG